MLLMFAGCTTFIGVTEEEYKTNPAGYATLTTGGCSFCSLKINSIDGGTVDGSVIVLSPGVHSIRLQIYGTCGAQGDYIASLSYNFSAGRKYAVQGDYTYRSPRVFITPLRR